MPTVVQCCSASVANCKWKLNRKLHLVGKLGGDQGGGAGGVGADAWACEAEGVGDPADHEAQATAHNRLWRQLSTRIHHHICVFLVHAAHKHPCTATTTLLPSLEPSRLKITLKISRIRAFNNKDKSTDSLPCESMYHGNISLLRCNRESARISQKDLRPWMTRYPIN